MMKKKAMAVVLVTAMLAMGTNMQAHWAEENIQFVLDKGLFKGLNGNEFMPEEKMSRDMLVTALSLLDGDHSHEVCNFSDVPPNSLYAPYIGWAAKEGITKGIGNNRFAPEDPVTREQLATIFLNYLNYIEFDFVVENKIEPFYDEKEISPWAKDAVYTMRSIGIMEGKPGNMFDPKGVATRAEVATMIENLFYIALPQPIVGGYTTERSLTPEDKKIFDEAMPQLNGEGYEPLKVSTQVVEGTNYKFYTKVTGTTLDAKVTYQYIYIFKPLGDGKATFVTSEPIESQPIVGGYTTERSLTPEDKKIFDEAMPQLDGEGYEPLKVSTQVVEGTNYKFYTKVTGSTLDAKVSYQYIYIFKPLGDGKATFVTSEPIESQPIVGGYTTERSLTSEDKKIFDEAMPQLDGEGYEPLKVSTQVVAGTNYKFYTKVTGSTLDAKVTYQYIYIFKPLGDGKATFVTSEPIEE